MKRAGSLVSGALVWALVVSTSQLAGQSPAADAKSPAFDVASVKPNKSVDMRRGGALQPGRLLQTNVTLLQLIQLTYSGQIAGGPSWVGVDRFDVDAKGAFDLSGFLPASDGSPAPVYLMLRSLLADRFQLKVHNETRELPVYGLEMARSDGKLGPQLRRADVDCMALMSAIAKSGQVPARPERGKAPACGSAARPGQITSTGVSMSRLCGMLSQFVNRPVVDRTTLAGDFILELHWTPDQLAATGPSGPNSSPSPDDASSIFTALQEQLGLRLEATRGPVDVLVIDRAEKPTPN